MTKKKKRKKRKDLTEVAGGLSVPPQAKKKAKRQNTEPTVAAASSNARDGGSSSNVKPQDLTGEGHGPHFKLPSKAKPPSQTSGEQLPLLHGRITNINDEWQTTKESWAEITSVLKKYQKKCVWMPFYYDGKCADHLRELGFGSKVIHEKKDFFDRVKDKAFMKKVDLVLDNPPYTGQDLKERILSALATANKPFCLLLPSSVIFTKFIRDCLDMPAVQIIVPRKVFVKKEGDDNKPVPFKYLIWLCHRMKLPKDLNFV